MPKRERNTGLDILRILIIAGIVLYHARGMWPFGDTPSPSIITFMGMGVDILFVLSGFLLGHSLWWRNPGGMRVTSLLLTFLHRFLRIYLPYLPILALSWLAVYLTRREPFDLLYLFLLQNLRYRIPFFQISWFLATLIQFTFLALLLVPLLKRLAKNAQTANCFALLAIPLFLRWMASEHAMTSPRMGFWWVGLPFRFDSMWAGLLLARWIPDMRPARFHALSLSWFLLAIACMVASFHVWKENTLSSYLFTSPLLSLGALCLVRFFVTTPLGLSKSAKSVTTFLSDISYSIFLSHALLIHIFRLLHAKGIVTQPSLYAIALVASILAVGTLYHFLFEVPVLKWATTLLAKVHSRRLYP